METQTIAVISVTIILAGLVSAIGDRIGRAVAKRRVPVLGLRPRLAGSVVAILTGILIALGTLTGLSLASRTVREMLFHFDELKTNLRQYESQVRVLQDEVAGLERQRKLLGANLSKTQSELKNSEAQIITLENKIRESDAVLRSTTRKLQDTTRELDAAQNKFRETEARLKDVRLELMKQEKANRELKAQGERLRQENETLEEHRDGLVKAAKELEEKLQALRAGQIRIMANQPLSYIRIPSTANLPEVRELVRTSLSRLAASLEKEGLMLADIASEDEEELFNTLSMFTQDVVVVVYSLKNVLPEEKIELGFEIAPYRLIFKKDELIASVRIAPEIGRKDVTLLLPALFKVIRGVAIRKGLLPDLATGEVGTMSSEDVKRLEDLLGTTSGERILEIRSSQDCYTTDKIGKFSFKILSKK